MLMTLLNGNAVLTFFDFGLKVSFRCAVFSFSNILNSYYIGKCKLR